jgi:hypothetical protein
VERYYPRGLRLIAVRGMRQIGTHVLIYFVAAGGACNLTLMITKKHHDEAELDRFSYENLGRVGNPNWEPSGFLF